VLSAGEIVALAEAERTRDLYSLSSLCSPPTDDWPVLDVGALRGLPGEVVGRLSEHTEADPVALLLTFLTMFGAAVGPGPHAQADGAEHPGRLHSVLVGSTSKARKGTSLAQVRRIFTVADRRFVTERILGGFGSGESVVDGVADGEDHRLLVVEPEWARILSVGRREGSTLSPLLRQAWDGDRLAVRSRSGGSVVADGAHIGVLGHVTVEELRAKLTETEMANGFANRHLFALVKRSRLLPSGGNLDEETVDALGHKTRAALESARSVGRLVRTPEAEERWAELYYEMAADTPGGLLEAVIARDAAQVLRLSVLYSLCQLSRQIDVGAVEAAWAVWSYCRQSAAVIFGDASGNPVADRLLSALRDAGPDGLDGREMHQALSGHASRNEMKAAVDYLVSRGQVATRTEETGGRPRTITFAVQDASKASNANKGSRS